MGGPDWEGAGEAPTQTHATSTQGPPQPHQLRPSMSSRAYPVSWRKESEAKTMGQSGREGSEMTKFCGGVGGGEVGGNRRGEGTGWGRG